jgi:hypothetical protein
MQLDRNLKRYVRQTLRDFNFLRNRLKIVKEYLQAPSGEGMGGNLAEGDAYLDKQLHSDEYQRITMRLKAIQALWDVCDVEDRIVLRHYLDGMSWEDVGQKISLEVETFNTSRDPKLINTAARLWFGNLV